MHHDIAQKAGARPDTYPQPPTTSLYSEFDVDNDDDEDDEDDFDHGGFQDDVDELMKDLGLFKRKMLDDKHRWAMPAFMGGEEGEGEEEA